MKSSFIASGLSTALYLGGAVPVIFFVLFAGERFAPHSELLAGLMAAVLVGGGLLLAGALWGRSVARRQGWSNTRVVMAAAGVTYCVVTLATLQALGAAERRVVEQVRFGDLPVHVSFALLFTAANFTVMAVLGLLIGGLAKSGRLALRLAFGAGAAAALAFLLADVVQDLLGRRVGGPRAEETLTMISVALLGNLVAAFVGGGVLGILLAAGAASPRPSSNVGAGFPRPDGPMPKY